MPHRYTGSQQALAAVESGPAAEAVRLSRPSGGIAQSDALIRIIPSNCSTALSSHHGRLSVTMSSQPILKLYRGRLAPSPTGLLHLGHARTFWVAAERAAEHGGQLILRNEDLDSQRCRAEFVAAMFEDMRWLGIEWSEGPDCGGACGSYAQSARREHYFAAWKTLRERGMIYPCTCSRKDVGMAAGAPNDVDDEPVYPGHAGHREVRGAER